MNRTGRQYAAAQTGDRQAEFDSAAHPAAYGGVWKPTAEALPRDRRRRPQATRCLDACRINVDWTSFFPLEIDVPEDFLADRDDSPLNRACDSSYC